MAAPPDGYEMAMATTPRRPAAGLSTRRRSRLSAQRTQDTESAPEPMLDPDWIDALLRSRNPSVLRT